MAVPRAACRMVRNRSSRTGLAVRSRREFEDAAAIIARPRVHDRGDRSCAVPAYAVARRTVTLVNLGSALQFTGIALPRADQLGPVRRAAMNRQLLDDFRLQFGVKCLDFFAGRELQSGARWHPTQHVAAMTSVPTVKKHFTRLSPGSSVPRAATLALLWSTATLQTMCHECVVISIRCRKRKNVRRMRFIRVSR